MAGIQILFVAVAAVCLTGVVAQERCFPDEKSDCTKAGVEGWTYFSTMQYKYFPKRLSQKDADAFCSQWSTRICTNRRMRSALGSFILEKENDDAILAAYGDAAITSSALFWTGVRPGNRRARRNQLYYTDGSRTSNHGFGDEGIPDIPNDTCVAQNGRNGRMVLRKCSDELGFVCKIQPRKH